MVHIRARLRPTALTCLSALPLWPALAFAPSTRRHLPLVLYMVVFALEMSAGPHAQGYGPAPLVNLFTQGEAFIIYVLCPVGAVWLLAKAALNASRGHHGGETGAMMPVLGAAALLTITVIRGWMRNL